jgi:hypothetical protein
VENEFELGEKGCTRYFWELYKSEIAQFIPNSLGHRMVLQNFIEKYHPNPRLIEKCECISKRARPLTVDNVSHRAHVHFKDVNVDPRNFTTIEEILKYCGLTEQKGLNEVIEHMKNQDVTFQLLFLCTEEMLFGLTKHCTAIVLRVHVRMFTEVYRPIMIPTFTFK